MQGFACLLFGLLWLSVCTAFVPKLPSYVKTYPWSSALRTLEASRRGVLSQSSREGTWQPGDAVPPTVLPTLAGNVNLSTVQASTIFNVFDSSVGFSRSLWGSLASVDSFLAVLSPDCTAALQNQEDLPHFVFLSRSVDPLAREDVEALQALLQTRMKALGLSPRCCASLNRRLHFVSTSTQSLSTASGAWVREVLREWTTFQDQASFALPSSSLSAPRLDARYDWLGWAYDPSAVFGNQSVPLVDFADGCLSPPVGGFAGSAVLVSRSGNCSFFEKVVNAEKGNASAVVVYSSENVTMIDMNCEPFCGSTTQPNISATMVSYATGMAVVAALREHRTVNVSFSTLESLGTDFGLDASTRLLESWGGSGLGSQRTSGNPGDKGCKLLPVFAFLGWAAQRTRFQTAVQANLSQPATSIPVFTLAPLRPANGNCYGSEPFGCGPAATVTLPPKPSAARLTLDFALTCNGTKDLDCPQWDHVISLHGCCGVPCNAIQGLEFGRWITPFSRRGGHWLTEASPMLAALYSPTNAVQPQCNFTVFTVPWAGNQGQIPWLVSLQLRLESTALTAPPPPPLPTQLLPLWTNVTTESGGVSQFFRWVLFNQSYNTFFPPVSFDVPSGVRKVVLMATISGHGNDNHGCAEFCPTTHWFVVNGHSFLHNQSLPGTDPQLGCTQFVLDGVTPNEYGTWLYGRDGWCNGRDVLPWEVDISSAVLSSYSSSSSNLIKYFAHFNGTDPDPGPPSTWSQAAPEIMISAFLAFY